MDTPHGKIDLRIFDGKGDFGLWKHKLMCQLQLLGLHKVLQEKPVVSSTTAESGDGGAVVTAPATLSPEEEDKEMRAKNIIWLSLSDSILRKVMHEKTALDIWKALERNYQSKSLPHRIHMKGRFASFKMDEAKSIEENLDVFLKLVSDLASLGINISDEDQAIQVLYGLPKQFGTLSDNLKYGSGKDTLTMEDVTSAAYSKEADLKEAGLLGKPNTNAEGLYVAERGRSEKRGKGKGKGKGRSKSRNRSKSKNRGENDGEKDTACWKCGKEGHFKLECPEYKKKSQANSANSANLAQEHKEQPLVLTASEFETKDQWVMDSGCSFHITPEREVLFDLKEFEGGKVLMANNTYSTVKGIGNIRILNPDGSVVILTGVRYMPSMSRNLISYGLLEKSGCEYKGSDFTVQFYKQGKKVISGKYHEGLYYLQGSVVKGEVNTVQSKKDMTDLWHSRLGHMGFNSLKLLVKLGRLPKDDINQLEFCDNCALGKSQKLKFPTGQHITKGILEYVHSDLWGSPNVPASLGGCKYFLTFIDDFSRKLWVYFLRTKDEVFTKFKDWKIEVENQTGKTVKYLRTDNGLEFCNLQFDEFCRSAGIQRHKTCTYTPQQNGIAERMNLTIMNKVRCMLAESGLGEEFWAEAASTAAYLINRSPNSSLDYQIPEEKWTSSEVNLSYLKRFGCSAFVHTVQGKTEPRAIKGIFVGYPFGVKGYRIWLPTEGKCTTSRNVKFNEDELYMKALSTPSQDDSSTDTISKIPKKVTFSKNLIQGPTLQAQGHSDFGSGGNLEGLNSEEEGSGG